MRIMYVEDNLANLNLVKRIARVGGHDIVTYSNGPDALKALETDPCHLILMDIELEGAMDGIEVIKRLRARGDQRPIIAITAYAMAGDKKRIMEAGCNEYLPKPLPISQFLTYMAKYDPKNVQPEPPEVSAKEDDKDPTKPREDVGEVITLSSEETIPTRDMIDKALEAKGLAVKSSAESESKAVATEKSATDVVKTVKTETVGDKQPTEESEVQSTTAKTTEESTKRVTVVTNSGTDEQQPKK